MQVMLIANTAIYFAVFGIPSSVYYFLPRSADKKRMMKNTISLLFGISAAVSLCLYFSSDFIAGGFNNPDVKKFGWLIAAFIFLQIPIKLYEPFMVSTKNVLRFVIVNASFNAGFLMVVLIPVLLGWQLEEVLLALLYFFIGQLLAVYTMITITYIELREDPGGEEYLVKNQIAYSLPIGLSGAMVELGKAVDKMIVSGYYDPEQLAIYGRGAMEIPLLNVVANSLGNILMPKFVEEFRKGNIGKVMVLWHSSIKMMAMFIYPALVYLILTAGHLIPFLFTDEYIASVIIFQVYTVGLITRITSYDAIIRAVGKTKVIFKISILAVVLNILFTVMLIELIGIVGAPLATVLVGATVRTVYLIVITKLLEVPISKVFPWSSLIRLIGASLIAGLTILPILNMDLRHSTMLVATSLTFALAYIVAFRYSKALNESELNSVRGILPKKIRWIL